MTPINSLLPIAAAAPDQPVAGGSPLAGFGELIAGLILQGEQEAGSLLSQGQDETDESLPEEQVSTAMLLASLPVTDEAGATAGTPALPEVAEADAPEVTPDPAQIQTAITLAETPSVPPVVSGVVPENVPPAQVTTASQGDAADTATPHGLEPRLGKTTGSHAGDVVVAEAEARPAGQSTTGTAPEPVVPSEAAPPELGTPVTSPDGEAPIAPVAKQSSGPGENHSVPASSNPTAVAESAAPALGNAVPPHSTTGEPGDGPTEAANRPMGVEPSSVRPDPTPQAVSNAAPSAVSSAPSAAVVEVPQTVIARVEQAIEMIENAPPPRRITIDAAELDGVRLTVSIRPDGVTVTSQTADASVIEAIERALAARGFDLADSGRQGRRPSDPEDRDTWQPPTAPPTRQATRDQGIRL